MKVPGVENEIKLSYIFLYISIFLLFCVTSAVRVYERGQGSMWGWNGPLQYRSTEQVTVAAWAQSPAESEGMKGQCEL